MINTNTLPLNSLQVNTLNASAHKPGTLKPDTLKPAALQPNSFRQEYQGQLAKELAYDRFGLGIASRLSDATNQLPHEISERLRVARMQALGKRKVASARTASSVVASGSAAAITFGDAFGDEKFSLWNAIASALPLIALIVGLISINVIQNNDRAGEVAEIDSALLTDDLPPTAYTDPGFVQFLKARRDLAQ
jgi:Protein of unknown function (DUF3619)